MKKIIVPIIVLTMLLTSCKDKASENAADTSVSDEAPMQGKNIGGEKMTIYDEEGISFEIPEIWQSNFKAVTREAGSSGNTYPQTEFYYTQDNRDIRLMSIGKFTREQWESLKKSGQSVEDALLGESADKKHVYSIFYEDHSYITDEPLKQTLGKIRTEAEKIREKITVR